MRLLRNQTCLFFSYKQLLLSRRPKFNNKLRFQTFFSVLEYLTKLFSLSKQRSAVHTQLLAPLAPAWCENWCFEFLLFTHFSKGEARLLLKGAELISAADSTTWVCVCVERTKMEGSKPKKFSKKSKKNWRKHSKVKDVEQYLEDRGREEIFG